MTKKKEDKKKPKVNPELQGFNIEIDSFGEIKTNYDIDKINQFLNKNVKDKKLTDTEKNKSETKEKDNNAEDIKGEDAQE